MSDSFDSDAKMAISNYNTDPTESDEERAEQEAVEHSLPSPEDVRSSIVSERGFGGKVGGGKVNMKWVWIGGTLALLLLVVLIPAVALTRDRSSGSSSTTQERTQGVEEVIQYLVDQGVSPAQVFEDQDSPQLQAATWLAVEDPANLDVPSNPITSTIGYKYMFRYIMTLNYYAMGGENWYDDMNFLTGNDICEWHSDKMDPMDHQLGVICTGSHGDPVPGAVYFSKSTAELATFCFWNGARCSAVSCCK